MRTHPTIGACAALVLLVFTSTAWAADATGTRVMTRNLYIGADVFAAINVPPEQIPFAAGEVLAEIIASDFPARARLLAREIARKQPQVIGLQEVWNVQASSATAPPIDLDFLAILVAELEARGQKYAVAVANVNVDVPALPALLPGVGLYLGQIQDRDVILVRHNVAWSNPRQGTYPTGIDLPDVFGFDIVRGWTSVDVVFGGNPYRFVNTHLEVESFGDGLIQTLQAIELQQALGYLAATLGALPEVVVGDFNSDPADAGCMEPTYCAAPPLQGVSPYVVLSSGAFGPALADTWTLRNNRDDADGATCCYDSLIAADGSQLTRRVDQIWIRGTDANGVTVRTSGDDTRRLTPGGLFGSDHLGVSARMSLVPAY